jgi:hypothetical protein
VQVIDNPFRSHKIRLLLETRFGGGNILSGGTDLPRLADKNQKPGNSCGAMRASHTVVPHAAELG